MVALAGHQPWHRSDPGDLERHVDEWVRAGIVSGDQADAIRRFEGRRDERPPERLTIGAEVASYLGSVLALMGGALVIGRRWRELGIGGQLLVAVLIAAVGLVAGRWLFRQHEGAMDRLGGFMWVIGAGGAAMFVGLAVNEWGPSNEAWIPLVVGVAVFALGLGLWRNRDRPLQLLTVGAGAWAATIGGSELLDVRPWYGGILFVVAGAAVAVAAAVGRLHPRLVGVGAGVASAFGGAMVLMELNEHLGPFVALVVAVSAVVFALADRSTVLLVLGVVATLIATEMLLATTFDGLVASAIVAALGMVIVVIALVSTSRRRAAP